MNRKTQSIVEAVKMAVEEQEKHDRWFPDIEPFSVLANFVNEYATHLTRSHRQSQKILREP